MADEAKTPAWNQASEIHLDPVGGISGDMFIGAASDAWPEVRVSLDQAFAEFPFPAGCKARFDRTLRAGISAATFQFAVAPAAGRGAHSYDEAYTLLAAAHVPAEVSQHALGIYNLLAEAEAAVHGVPIAEVHFHELGDWDSVADVLGAAVVIASFPGARWHVESLPIGSGYINTAHGRLPVPAPAAAWLTRGFRCHDDGLAGERVTPTGAAILRYLKADAPRPTASRELLGIGYGAGSRELPGVPNVLRLMAFGATAGAGGDLSDRVVVVRFEVDDQTPEDLALGLERVRAVPGVLDVMLWSAQGKKGRMLYAVQVLAEEQHDRAVIEACLAETTTIGVRWHHETRSKLPRHETLSGSPAGQVRVKQVSRPGGQETRKAEADDIAGLGLDYAGRSRARRRAEDEE